ncbi:hypothetical protein N7492_004545 [Penicillium capsulatum]|uniref:Uncharacterized protein n=1 Tax=Penicillium capsulatum TaxID=69766 RepID=A0A9W9IBR6_9EURO|nr:hypothetical protein N7492_004545 [Penicillium capsulatum]KAJ6136338.1 hypothetical protein N7512_001498 [Penicillium capsulatum]
MDRGIFPAEYLPQFQIKLMDRSFQGGLQGPTQSSQTIPQAAIPKNLTVLPQLGQTSSSRSFARIAGIEFPSQQLKDCPYCHKPKPIAAFKADGREFITCDECRQRKRGYSRRHAEKVKAQLAASQNTGPNNPSQTWIIHPDKREDLVNQGMVMALGLPNAYTIPGQQSPNSASRDTEASGTTSSDKVSSSTSDTEHDSAETIEISPTDAWFRCLHCGIARGAGLKYSGICVYCFENEQKYCVLGAHEDDRNCFVDDDGVEHSECNSCREHL